MSAVAPRIAMQLVEPMIDWLEARQVDVQSLLKAAGLVLPSRAAPNAMVPLSRYVDLFERAAQATGDSHLGLRFGQFDEPGTLGELGFLFMSGASLLDAFEGFCAHLDALQEDTTNRVLIDGDTVTVQYRINDSRISLRRQDSEYSIAAMYRLTELFAGAPVRLRKVCFEHKRAGRYATYRERFQCEVYFEQPYNQLVFRRDGFNVRNHRRSHLLNPIIASHLSALSARHENQRTHRAQVVQLIELHISDAHCNQATIARMLGMSTSTLIRHLRDEGASFRELLAECRLQHAERLLQLDDTPIAAIALAVGYSENASFTRAFRRKHKQSPDQYRRARRLATMRR